MNDLKKNLRKHKIQMNNRENEFGKHVLHLVYECKKQHRNIADHLFRSLLCLAFWAFTHSHEFQRIRIFAHFHCVPFS